MLRQMSIEIIEAGPEHYVDIVSIERESATGSLVALTEGHALSEASARGHHVVVAVTNGAVAGWAWFGRSLERGAEEVGQVYRIAVKRDARRTGAGAAMLAHVRAELNALGIRRIRATLPGDDADTRAFFEASGFVVDAVIMEGS